MSQATDLQPETLKAEDAGITSITVAGYKSLRQQQDVEIRPLTILAGANSSGKSSLMQPLLLLKQTLEATYDPGALLLNGPNVRFTAADQLLSRMSKDERMKAFSIGVGLGAPGTLTTQFKQKVNKGFEIEKMEYAAKGDEITCRPRMTDAELKAVFASQVKEWSAFAARFGGEDKIRFAVSRKRCFLEVLLGIKQGESMWRLMGFQPGETLDPLLRRLIHVPGLRGNPERTYPVTAVGSAFPGTFENYTASVIAQWQTADKPRLENLGGDCKRLGLTWKVGARPIDDTQVELQVGRLCRAAQGGAWDLVNIADVGFGLSQTLPVLVALRAAADGQLVYLEQPEIHLHPKAQSAMAAVIADAAKRGVRVVVETHSELLILGVQTLVAEGKLSPDLVKLHWFLRQNDGATKIESADLDDAGRFGDWPEDFAEVALRAESRFLDAVEAKKG